MRMTLPFGRQGITIDVPEANLTAILTAPQTQPVDNPQAAVAQALVEPIDGPPLQSLARGKPDAVIAVCDITRPVPNRTLLPPILDALHLADLTPDDITILIATGLHRSCDDEELVEMLGAQIVDTYRVVNHRATVDAQHIHLGPTESGLDVFMDRTYAQASLKITTGYIEPHLMAGFSGGRKVCAIGLAGESTIRALHGPRIIEHPHSIEGCLDGNLLHAELNQIAALAGVDFIVNVTLDQDRRITSVFAGHSERAFEAGCRFARQNLSCSLDAPADIVVASCGGHPQDINYYQSAKGFTAAMQVCKPGGTIILLSKCEKGLGKPAFQDLCRQVQSVEYFENRFIRDRGQVRSHARRIDQWQIHNLIRALRKCHLHLVDGGLSPQQRRLLLHPAGDSFQEALDLARVRHGPDASLAIVPDGPNVLAGILSKKA